mgnify:CR=1 FL=1
MDHGIGKFGGLQKIDVQGKKQEAIKLLYRNNDLLYVSIHSLHKISKYNSKEGTAPKIHQLGSPQWAKTKSKTKTKIKTIAYDLIKLYAKRKAVKGFAYSPDNYLQYERTNNPLSWDALSFNRIMYYDLWALSIDPYGFSCNHYENTHKVKNQMIHFLKEELFATAIAP